MRNIWLIAIILTGCGEPPVMLHPVRGTVTKDGQPIAGTIQFINEKDPALRAVGAIATDGRYTLRTLANNSHRTGVQAGGYRATILYGKDVAVHHGTVYMVVPGDNVIDIAIP